MLKRAIAALSATAGTIMASSGIVHSNLDTGLNGAVAIALAVVTWQLADIKERMVRLEDFIFRHSDGSFERRGKPRERKHEKT